MATKKYLSLERLTEYDALIKAEIAEGDASVKSYVDTEVAKKANSSHTHDDRYYTETEIDGKLSAINTSIGNITSGSTPVKEAEHADSATSSLDAEKLGGQLPSYYAKASDIPTGSLASKSSVSESDLDSALAEKVNAAAEGNHSHSNKTVLDGITSAKVSAWDSAESNAKTYADNAATTAANKVKDDLLNGAGTAYDTLKELGELIDDNKDAIDALEDIASGKANATHSHAISDVTGLQNALDAKDDAIEEVKTDVTNMSVAILAEAQKGIDAVQTNLDALEDVVNGKSDSGHGHAISDVTDLQSTLNAKAARTSLDSHTSNTTVHITSTERTNWGSAYTHSTSAHAPSNAQANVIESIKVNGTAQTITSKAVNITVPTKASDIGAAENTHSHAISDITNLQTTLNNAANGIQTNTNSINVHTDRISALETKVGDGLEEISSEEISALFSN